MLDLGTKLNLASPVPDMLTHRRNTCRQRVGRQRKSLATSTQKVINVCTRPPQAARRLQLALSATAGLVQAGEAWGFAVLV